VIPSSHAPSSHAPNSDDEERYLSVAKAGGDPRARIDTAYRPLQKVKITDATLLR
jgi:hypothetical protein